MTKEELKQEAEGYVCERNPLVTKKWFIDAFKKYDKGEKVKYLKDCEIAEYKAYLASAEPREKRIAELEKENAELRKEWQEQVQKATDEGYARTLQTIQLTKAKEIIHKVCYEYGIYDKDLMEEAKQFLKEVEK